MKHVSQRFGMHQPVLDGDVQQQFRTEFISAVVIQCDITEYRIHMVPHLPHIVADRLDGRPVRRLVVRQASIDRINPKRKESIEFGMKRRPIDQSFPQQVPIKSLKVAYVEDDPMTFWNWP